MALFEFELTNVEDIRPWGKPGEEKLHWFGLTLGTFRMVVGEQVLFRYTDAIRAHWNMEQRDADYQIAQFARDMLECVAPAVAALPPRIEQLAANWPLLLRLEEPIEGTSDADRWEKAWTWLSDRSPETEYLIERPRIVFLRVGNEVRIHWDNRDRQVDGIPLWTAEYGVHAMSVEAFLQESRDFASRLLAAMDQRIAGIENGTLLPRCPVNPASLREEHRFCCEEFETYFIERRPYIPWPLAEAALLETAAIQGIRI